MTEAIRVVLVDDQALVRAGFAMILSVEEDIEIVGEAGDGSQAVAVVDEVRPDVVLMDVQMPTVDGIEATRQITSGTASSKIVMLTTFDDDDHLFDALDAGASGFLLKNCPPNDLVNAIRLAASGHSLLAPEVTSRVIARSSGRHDSGAGSGQAHPGLDELTDREQETLVLMARGMSNAEIAAEMFVSGATVKSHVSRILTKLQVRDRVHAVIVAHQAGLMDA